MAAIAKRVPLMRARLEAQRLRQGRDEQHRAATTIQAHVRMWQARRMLQRAVAAATRIQVTGQALNTSILVYRIIEYADMPHAVSNVPHSFFLHVDGQRYENASLIWYVAVLPAQPSALTV